MRRDTFNDQFSVLDSSRSVEGDGVWDTLWSIGKSVLPGLIKAAPSLTKSAIDVISAAKKGSPVSKDVIIELIKNEKDPKVRSELIKLLAHSKN